MFLLGRRNRHGVDIVSEAATAAGARRLYDYQNSHPQQIDGDYDAILATSASNLSQYRRLLRPGGKAVLQAITMDDDHYQSYLSECDWIQRYIFPGGSLVSVGHLRKLVRELTSFEMDEPRTMAADYARTLQLWRERFHAAHDQIAALGFDERFVRMWHYYLCYCEAGFLSGPIDTVQVTLSK